MRRIVKLTENDLHRIVKRVIQEQEEKKEESLISDRDWETILLIVLIIKSVNSS